MAELAIPDLIFDTAFDPDDPNAAHCPDCAERVAVLPLPIPGVEDNFDWSTRDYDSFRLFMMQELASRFPQRSRWTPADMEVVVVELLSAALDRASHAIDRVQAERFLDSARRPSSVRRLLKLIGYDATEREDRETLLQRRLAAEQAYRNTLDAAALASEPPIEDILALPITGEEVDAFWRDEPGVMNAARARGPREIAAQHRMVTLNDHAEMLEKHPLVAIARARLVWTGAWQTVLVSVLLEDDLPLDGALIDDGTDKFVGIRPELLEEVEAFHVENLLPMPPKDTKLTGRKILRIMIDDFRLIGSEVFLEAAKGAAISLTLSVRAKPGFFRSELKQALAQVFSSDQGGFFEPGRLDFGQALYASDVIEAAVAVEGVAVACLNRFRRVGKGYEDQSADGVIKVDEDAFILCRNDRTDPTKGTLRIEVNGGEAA